MKVDWESHSIAAGRLGRLRVVGFGSLPDENCPFGIYTDGRNARYQATARAGDPPVTTLEELIGNICRLYVSSVAFAGPTLVADGFDNVVFVLSMGG